MPKRLKYADALKARCECVIHTSEDGHMLRVVLDLTNERIVFHVVPKDSNIVDCYFDFKKAVDAYNAL